jgi:hypothetical protein
LGAVGWTAKNGDFYLYGGGSGTNLSETHGDLWKFVPDPNCPQFTCTPPIVNFNTALPQICPGTCTSFLNLSVNASSYEWNFPGATPGTSTAVNPNNICYSSPGSYDVQLIATNSNGSDTLTLQNYITVYPFPFPQGIQQSEDTLFANQGATSYQWYFNGNIIGGATDYFYIAQTSGDYNVIATDANGCEVEAVITDVLAHTPLAVGYLPLAIYPNPVSETIEVRGLGTNSADEVLIYNVVGEKVFSAIDCKLPIVDCQLSSGMYYIEITVNNKIFRSKFMKQ